MHRKAMSGLGMGYSAGKSRAQEERSRKKRASQEPARRPPSRCHDPHVLLRLIPTGESSQRIAAGLCDNLESFANAR